LLSYAFDGDTYFAGVAVRSERAFWWSLEKGSEIIDTGLASSEKPWIDLLFPKYKPDSATWKLIVWATQTRVFWGSFFN
ncbi:hypothetical protein LCGC14_1967320, partial [marine sediment metagenome]